MIKVVKAAAAFACLVFPGLANAGRIMEMTLTESMSADIQSNGDYTFQNANDVLDIEYWLHDELAMVRFSADSINAVFYSAFMNDEDKSLVTNTYTTDPEDIVTFYDSEFSNYQFTTTSDIDFIDFVWELDTGFVFSGLNFEDKEFNQDAIFTNNFANLYFEDFVMAGFEVTEASVPTPSSLALFGLAATLLLGRRFSK